VSFRAKLLAIVGIAAAALVALTVTSALISEEVAERLETIEDVYVPRVELGPRLEAELNRLSRRFQDAVAAHDTELLASARIIRDNLLEQITRAGTAIDDALAAELRDELQDYFAVASDVSRRLIEGEMGEPIVEDIARMQERQKAAFAALEVATVVDRNALAEAFGEAASAEATASEVRLGVSLAFLALALAVSLLLARAVLRSFRALSDGFERFARGDFATPIPILAKDELGGVARRANAMAETLASAAAERDDGDWLKNGIAGLSAELRGELEAGEVARRALSFLASYLGAPAGTLYYADTGPEHRLLASYGLSAESSPPAAFKVGEGLIGEAALGRRLMIVRALPPDYMEVRSGTGRANPRTLALLPLVYANRVTGVLELAAFDGWEPLQSELLEEIRDVLTVALHVAHRREETQALLAETRAQARRLADQDEELRRTNEELHLQQEELRQTNIELKDQADTLAKQQEELEERHAALEETRKNLEIKAGELEMVSAFKSQFLTNMSHELRTPLNSMLLLSNLLAENRDGNLHDKQVEYCTTIHSAGTDLLALINQVLDLARVESGKHQLALAPTKLAEVADRARRVFEPQAKKEGLDLRVEIAPGLPERIVTDQQRVDQILTNLLGNAIKFTPDGEVALRIAAPATDVELRRPGLDPAAAVALSVSDTGPGIPADARDRIFAPFEQIDPRPDRRYGGTGLGLALVNELVDLLGGELQLESEVGRGSTFTCYLPFDPADVIGAEATAASRVAPRPTVTTRTDPEVEDAPKRPRGVESVELLLIEDDDVFAGTLAELADEAGLSYARATDGRSGLAMAKATRPGGIVLDVRLPALDGFEVMRRLREDPATRDIPVHFASVLDSPERGLALGAIGYLVKPAQAEELREMIAVLAPKPGERLRVLIVEDDVQVGHFLSRPLERDGVTVDHVLSAQAARDALDARRYDSVILDLGLPDMDGLDLLAELHERHADLPPVIISTARTLSDDERRRLEEQAEAIIQKDGASTDRVLSELRLFVRRIREGFAPRRARRKVPSDRPVRLDGRRVLVVDDDMRTVYALSAALRAKGADVLVADTGVAALDVLAEEDAVDIVLMDIMMPEMDGYEAMRRIRAQERFARLPIVALTAKAMKGDADRCVAAGASDYMAKPIDADRLFALLAARLDGGARRGA